MSRSLLSPALGFLLFSLALAPVVRGEPLGGDDLRYFETKIRPLLVKHCYECHSAEAKELGGKLRLDSREAWRAGGETGPAIVPGKPEESLLVQAIRYDGLEMPPEAPLPEAAVHELVEWVRRGAPDPRAPSPEGPAPAGGAPSAEPAEEETLWSLRPVRDPELPAVAATAWPRDPLDYFLLAEMERAGLAPTGDAEPRALARRLHHDLLGLPPTPEELETFLAEHAQDGAAAVERLVDRLLASPHYGEHWGRHWLDVARYGESNGNDGLGRNPTFPHAWRYRDYVIAAFNEDTPYNRFLTEQIAGDLLPSDSPEQRDRQLVATGLLAMGAKPAKAMNTNFDMDVVADQLDVIGRGMLGLGIGCARCHDHKFDPIPTRDYYALAGIFTSTETLWGTAAHEKLTAPPTDLHVLQAAAKVPPPEGFTETVLVLESNTGKPRPVPKPKWAPGTPLAMGLRDREKPADAKINIKGESAKLGEAVPRGFLAACGPLGGIAVDPAESGRRQLAEWITHPDHPLTARVWVNRVWLHLFGEGIVRTPDDFGVYGERPTHPELLDHLAARFVREGWSVKGLVRAIVLSRAYQLSSSAGEKLLAADAENKLFARRGLRRLSAEGLRDAMLRASGELNLEPAAGSLVRHRDILVNLAGNLHEPSRHRSVYLCYLRSSPPPELAPFDLPDFTTVVGRREANTLPSQALHLFNSPFVVEQGRALARRVSEETADPVGRAREAFRRVLLRPPSAEELEQALGLVRSLEESGLGSEAAWGALGQGLLAANEFRYID